MRNPIDYIWDRIDRRTIRAYIREQERRKSDPEYNEWYEQQLAKRMDLIRRFGDHSELVMRWITFQDDHPAIAAALAVGLCVGLFVIVALLP